MASPDNRVVIEGHTDNIPIRRSPGKRYLDNMELSFLRAKAVASILVKNGISPERISVVGYGDSRPIDSNETVSGRINNRRVEVKLTPEDKEF
jgi:flagellar motor protein MotB